MKFSHEVNVVWKGHNFSREEKMLKQLRKQPTDSGFTFRTQKRDMTFRFRTILSKRKFLKKLHAHPIFKELKGKVIGTIK